MSNCDVSFLDLSLIIKAKNLRLSYLIRRCNPSSLILMTYLDSNTPSNIYDTYIGSEILRFVRTTFDSNTFITLSDQIFKKYVETGH